MKTHNTALIGAIIFFIIVMITISVPIYKKTIIKPTTVEVEVHPMMYTWDDGSGDICLPE